MDRFEKMYIVIVPIVLIICFYAVFEDSNANKSLNEKVYSVDSYEEETQSSEMSVTTDDYTPFLREELIAIPGFDNLCYGSVSVSKYCFMRSDSIDDTKAMEDFIFQSHPCKY